MTARDDLERAARDARAQVDAARAALAASREARGGGRAKDARTAERQLHALRAEVVADVRTLRDRLVGSEPTARRGIGRATAVGGAAVATVVGAAFAVRGRVRRGAERRGLEHQAAALADALARRTVGGADGGPAHRSSDERRRRGGALLAVLVSGAAVAAAVVAQQRRSAPVDHDDLWLPERGPGPA